jgi:LytS/YehU family sensor histidine kinase
MEQEYQRNLWQAEILASRMQMNPHFLFNCLNSVKYFFQKRESQEAIKYLTTLSKLMREILQTGKQQSISLFEELEMVKKYVQLEANRFNQDLDFGVFHEGFEESDLKSIHIPPLILQPFIENAIWHGLVPSQRSDKRLGVELSRENNHLVVSLEDNGVGRNHFQQSQNSLHKGMGIQITADRISLFNKMTKNEIKIETIDLQDDHQQPTGTCVKIYIKESAEPVSL